MIHKLIQKIYNARSGFMTVFSFAGGTPAQEGTGERSSSGDFQERDIPVHACKPPYATLCQICKNLASNENNYNAKLTPIRSFSERNSLLFFAILCVSGALILSSCSSMCRKDALAQLVLEKEHQVLLDLKADADDSAVVSRVGKDPVLRARENRLRSAIKALIESNEAIRKTF